MTSELAHCPFCGGKVHISGIDRFECEKCGMAARMPFPDRERNVECWNTRYIPKEIEFPWGVTEFEPAPPLGYYGSIDMWRCSTCHGESGTDEPNFCCQCGKINRMAPYQLRRTRAVEPAKLIYWWYDEEDGTLWECGTCGEQFHADDPVWCPHCGRPFDLSEFTAEKD